MLQTRLFTSAFAILLLAAGCGSPQMAGDMDSRVPYRLTYDGTSQEAETLLRRSLRRDEWAIVGRERGKVVATKVLPPDEMESSQVVTGQMVGAGGGGQRGRLSLSVTRKDETTQVFMQATIANEATGRRSEKNKSVQRSHPLMVKMGLRLHDLPELELVDPPASWLREWRRSTRRR